MTFYAREIYRVNNSKKKRIFHTSLFHPVHLRYFQTVHFLLYYGKENQFLQLLKYRKKICNYPNSEHCFAFQTEKFYYSNL